MTARLRTARCPPEKAKAVPMPLHVEWAGASFIHASSRREMLDDRVRHAVGEGQEQGTYWRISMAQCRIPPSRENVV